MLNGIRTLVGDESGEDLIEYGLLAAFVAAVALVTLVADPLGLRPALVQAFYKAVEALQMAGQGDLVRT